MTHSVELPVSSLLPLAGQGTHVIYVCLAEDLNCGESHYNTIMGEVNGLYLSEHEIKFWTFCFLTCSPSPFSAPNFQNLSLLLSFFVPC